MVEAIGDAGCCFRRYDVADLARQIEWMFSGQHLAECKTRWTVARQKEFSLEAYGHRLRDVLAFAGVSK